MEKINSINNKYIIISSAYNEGKNIEQVIKSVIKQTVLPSEWIIINDGSTDETEQIIQEYSNKYKFIRLINKKNDNLEFGTHVAVNFNLGLEKLTVKEWDFIAQLDADISIDRQDFYEYQIKAMLSNDKLGNTSGITYTIVNGIKTLNKRRPFWRTGGATKFYKRKCFEDIGGILPIFAWDGLDVYKAMYNGWETRTFYDLEVNHLGISRMMDRHQTIEKAMLMGKSFYQRGYPVEFVLLKSISFLKISFKQQKSFLKGYFKAKNENIQQFVSKEEKKFIRNFQIKRILGII
jgi:glycosyltransferase involved in cell wall biosynthesis